jgi:YHS domain-containing protein
MPPRDAASQAKPEIAMSAKPVTIHGAFPMRIAAAAMLLAVLAGPSAVRAAEVNAVDGIAVKGTDVVAYFTEGRAVAGSAAFSVDHGGVEYRFASAEHRDRFLADPQAYLPQYGGFCAYAAARGYKADVSPDAFRVVDGRLYLNYDRAVLAEWAKDVPGYVAAADRNWPTVRLLEDVVR